MFAMKILKRDFIQERDEVEHTMTERKVMRTMRRPFLTVSETVCACVCVCACVHVCVCVCMHTCECVYLLLCVVS